MIWLEMNAAHRTHAAPAEVRTSGTLASRHVAEDVVPNLSLDLFLVSSLSPSCPCCCWR